MQIAPIAAAVLLAGTSLTLQVGERKTVSASFPVGGSDNSNPKVLKATVDSGHQRATLVGKAPGHATFTMIDARSTTHWLQYDVKVVPSPPPTPTPSPSPSPSPSATPSATPAATAPSAGSKT